MHREITVQKSRRSKGYSKTPGWFVDVWATRCVLYLHWVALQENTWAQSQFLSSMETVVRRAGMLAVEVRIVSGQEPNFSHILKIHAILRSGGGGDRYGSDHRYGGSDRYGGTLSSWARWASISACS